MARVLTPAQQLAEAEAALHALKTGKALVRVRKADIDATYQQANKSDLEAYVAELRGQVSTAQATPTRGPAFGVIF